MHLCAISFKECWQTESGEWYSSGGFPLQMAAIGSLFNRMTLLITRGRPLPGGIPLPSQAQVVPLHQPIGQDTRRKVSVISHLPYYLSTIAHHIRQADAVHTPLPGDIPLLGMMIALAMRKPLIARYGGSWQSTEQTTTMNRVTRLLMRRFAGGRNVMLATGEGDAPPAQGMAWIFSTALSQAELCQITPDLSRGIAQPVHLVYIGRLSPEKGVIHLLNAMELLSQSGFCPLPKVSLIGDGPERQRLENHRRTLTCAPNITFTGQLNRSQLTQVLYQADLCVQPSLTEGFSKAWLDAMAHGLPVLASEVGAARTVLQGNGSRGWLTSPGDARALADSLHTILTQTADWPVLRQRCRTYVEGRTLEAWAHAIGSRCALQWQITYARGKLSK
jgi:glycosyltransferase involved in cell wall biosynthesis